MTYLIQVESKNFCWIADIEGDPGRTLIRSNAKVFPNKNTAQLKLNKLRNDYPNRRFFLEENEYIETVV
jgi:hypothetical protein